MKTLPTNFRDGGINYTIAERENNIVLGVAKRADGSARGFIVFKIRQMPDLTIMENFCPAHESVPSPETFGDDAFSYFGGSVQKQEELAFNRYVRMVEQNKNVITAAPASDMPKQRGRARLSFDLNMEGLPEKFLFADVLKANSNVAPHNVRNRFNAIVESGAVSVVGQQKTSTGLGRAANVYSFV